MSGGDDRNKPADDEGASKEDSIDFHGAAIIDEEGHEIPITEEMIKDACKKLDPTATAPEDTDSDAG